MTCFDKSRVDTFLHRPKHGFLFILKNVLFRDKQYWNTHNIFKKDDSKKSMLSCILYWGEETWHSETNWFNLKSAGNLAFFSNRKSVRLRMRSWPEKEREEAKNNLRWILRCKGRFCLLFFCTFASCSRQNAICMYGKAVQKNIQIFHFFTDVTEWK